MQVTKTLTITPTAPVYAIFFYASPEKGYAPQTVHLSGGVTIDGRPYVADVDIYKNGVFLVRVRSNGLYGTFEYDDVAVPIGIYAYYAIAMGVTSVTRTVEIRAKLLVDFSADKTTGPIPLAVTFTCGASKGYLDYTWTLNPGDGSPIYSGTRTAEGTWTQAHTYNKTGTFTATLTVTDALGALAVTGVRILAGIKAWWDALTPIQKALAALSVIAAGAGAAYVVYTRKRH